MSVLYWLMIIAVFVIAFIGLVYPVIPSVIFIVAGFLLYGFLFSFSPYSYLFWLIEAVFAAVLFAADYVSNLLGVKRYGGSRAAIWGSTIGLLIVLFVIPVAGIILGRLSVLSALRCLFIKRISSPRQKWGSAR